MALKTIVTRHRDLQEVAIDIHFPFALTGDPVDLRQPRGAKNENFGSPFGDRNAFTAPTRTVALHC